MVKRLLLEELGTYLISETEVKNMQLTKEQVTAYSAGIVSAEVIEDKWDGKIYWLKATVSADPKEVAKSLEKIKNDQLKGKALEEVRKKAEDLIKENERLRKELEAGKKSGAKDKKIEVKIKEYENTIKGLNAIEWAENGSVAFKARNYQQAINDFSNVIELAPEWWAYIFRGFAYHFSGTYHLAIKDYTKAIDRYPNGLSTSLSGVYGLRGLSYRDIGNRRLYQSC